MNRRQFLRGGMGAAVLAARSADSYAQDFFSQNPAASGSRSWDAGRLMHLLPTVSDTRILIKASFTKPLAGAPLLRVGATPVRGVMTDTEGSFWEFHAAGLQPSRKYNLSLQAADRKPLCQPWELSTFPSPDANPGRFRVLFFTCAGGSQSAGYLATATRNRLLRRALSFEPQATVANGDHVYWDLHSPQLPPARRDNSKLDSFNRSALVFGDRNETVLKLAAGPQIAPVYGTDFRSTPVFFLQDDHDYFDNDEAFDEMITFPPVWFQLQMARATQRMYYPEFLRTRRARRGCRGAQAGRTASRKAGARCASVAWRRCCSTMSAVPVL